VQAAETLFPAQPFFGLTLPFLALFIMRLLNADPIMTSFI
jgi:hypothetical protein